MEEEKPSVREIDATRLIHYLARVPVKISGIDPGSTSTSSPKLAEDRTRISHADRRRHGRTHPVGKRGCDTIAFFFLGLGRAMI